MNADPQREFEDEGADPDASARNDDADTAAASDDAPTRETGDDAPTRDSPAEQSGAAEDAASANDEAPTAASRGDGAASSAPQAPASPGVPQPPAYSIAEERSAEPCPRCGAPVPAEALVCVKCGWDFARNEPTRTREEEATGAEVETEAEEGPTAISQPGRLGWKLLLIGGGAAFLAAAILAGVQAWSAAESGKLVQWVVAFLDVLIDGIIRTGLGLAALLFVARILEAPFGKIGLAAARMTLAVGLFYLAFFLARSLTLAPGVEWALGAGVGAALYYLVIMWAFSLERDAVLLVGGAHFILWLAVQAAVLLEMGRRAGFG